MKHQHAISGGLLIVGVPDIVTTCQNTPLSAQLTAIAAPAPTLHVLADSAEQIVAQHAVILFETDVPLTCGGPPIDLRICCSC